jgi:hypothetical protein
MCHYSDCGCKKHTYAERGHYRHVGYGCNDHRHLPRHLPNREEAAREMEDYLKQLQAEVKGVEERLSEINKDS